MGVPYEIDKSICMNKPDLQFYAEEKLYRAVPIGHPVMFDKNGKITSAVFQDSYGISVDRAWYRSPKEAVEALCDRLAVLQGKLPENYGVISVTKADCDLVEAKCFYAPSKNNIYHSLIKHSQNISKLTRCQSRKLALLAKVEK
ncbi:MAG: hypothetical protein J6O04_12020 [Selenomonadaceae bacterium]|nr:hypothetical protein [Selenomonadaceae bacterium]